MNKVGDQISKQLDDLKIKLLYLKESKVLEELKDREKIEKKKEENLIDKILRKNNLY